MPVLCRLWGEARREDPVSVKPPHTPRKIGVFIFPIYTCGTRNPSLEKKEPSINPMLGLMYSQSDLEIVAYLFVDGGALVAGGELAEVSSLLQPVSIIPIARPSSTIRVYILFIGTRNFYQKTKPVKHIFSPPQSCGLSVCGS